MNPLDDPKTALMRELDPGFGAERLVPFNPMPAKTGPVTFDERVDAACEYWGKQGPVADFRNRIRRAILAACPELYTEEPVALLELSRDRELVAGGIMRKFG